MDEFTDPSLPPVGGPTRVALPDGRTMTIVVTIDGAPAPPPLTPAAPAVRLDPAHAAPPAPKAATARVAAAAPAAAATRAAAATTRVADAAALDAPAVGGRFTAFTLLYGDYPDMHRRSLGSFLDTTPRDRVELRVISNQLGPASADYVAGLVRSGLASVHYAHPDNRRKYPAMRAAFRDPARPVATNYLIWFDDDTLFDVRADWLALLAEAIARGHPEGKRLFGPAYSWALRPGQPEWYRAASWYRGVPFQDAAGRPAPNGQRIHFASGGFWALAADVMRGQDVPDARLGHNGGDVAIGAAVAQGGWGLADFSSRKSVVNWSAFARRGVTEPHPGQLK